MVDDDIVLIYKTLLKILSLSIQFRPKYHKGCLNIKHPLGKASFKKKIKVMEFSFPPIMELIN